MDYPVKLPSISFPIIANQFYDFCISFTGPPGVPFNVLPNGAVPPQADQPPAMPAMNDAMFNSTATNTTSPANNSTTTTARPEYDDVEGSGDEDDDDNAQNTGSDNREEDLTSLLSIGSFITRAALFRRSLETPVHTKRTSKQFFSSCDDRITLPCIVEDFISVGSTSVPSCSPIHCGSTLCPRGGSSPCRIESTVTPFAIGIHFGEGTFKGNAEENIGACLRYKQVNCI